MFCYVFLSQFRDDRSKKDLKPELRINKNACSKILEQIRVKYLKRKQQMLQLLYQNIIRGPKYRRVNYTFKDRNINIEINFVYLFLTTSYFSHEFLSFNPFSFLSSCLHPPPLSKKNFFVKQKLLLFYVNFILVSQQR